MNKTLDLLKKIRDIIEIYLPIGMFSIMFLVFVLQIFMRYVMRQPITWAFEVSVVAFGYVVVLGAASAIRYNRHVRFTLIYDALSEKMQLYSRIAGNTIITLIFLLSIIPTWNFIIFMDFQKTSVLNISLSIVFLPFLYLVSAITLSTGVELFKDIKILMGKQVK
jgi:TRAP-type C4-dicarboxylate transport system permease small subunit